MSLTNAYPIASWDFMTSLQPVWLHLTKTHMKTKYEDVQQVKKVTKKLINKNKIGYLSAPRKIQETHKFYFLSTRDWVQIDSCVQERHKISFCILQKRQNTSAICHNRLVSRDNLNVQNNT